MAELTSQLPLEKSHLLSSYWFNSPVGFCNALIIRQLKKQQLLM
jgi:hypothetical protein